MAAEAHVEYPEIYKDERIFRKILKHDYDLA
jgi:hypothetical protein